MVRHILTHRAPGFTSIGHAVLVVFFLLLNILFLFIHMDFASILPFAKRLGWYVLSFSQSLLSNLTRAKDGNRKHCIRYFSSSQEHPTSVPDSLFLRKTEHPPPSSRLHYGDLLASSWDIHLNRLHQDQNGHHAPGTRTDIRHHGRRRNVRSDDIRSPG